MSFRRNLVLIALSVGFVGLAGCASLFSGSASDSASAFQAATSSTLRYYCVWGKWPTELPSENNFDLNPIKCYGNLCSVKVSMANDPKSFWYVTLQKAPTLGRTGEQMIPYKQMGYARTGEEAQQVVMNTNEEGNVSVTCHPEFSMQQADVKELAPGAQYREH